MDPTPAPTPEDDRARLLAELDADLAGVEAALRRLDDHTAFTCEACGAPLTEDRLRAAPLAVRCLACDPA
jgi:RNA polymerase-binding transcription factor DksA